MPELPEAETIAKGLARVLPGRRVARVQVLRQDVVDGPATRFAEGLSEQEIASVGRRGKNVVVRMAGGDRIVVNLGMTGRLLPAPTPSPPPGARHAAVHWTFQDDSSLTFDDVRRFGRVQLLRPDGWRAWTRRLGPEPLSSAFTGVRFRTILDGSRSPIRSLLLDQRKIAGVGNIYAVEALWGARIHPARPANGLTDPEGRALHRSLRRVLRRAIAARGTTLRDYRTAEGESGGFAPALDAYGREGQGCRRCRSTMERIRLSGRSAFFCPRCQPAARTAAS
jgi:formamidopyrimidine-DNA glycosylase